MQRAFLFGGGFCFCYARIFLTGGGGRDILLLLSLRLFPPVGSLGHRLYRDVFAPTREEQINAVKRDVLTDLRRLCIIITAVWW